MDKKIGPVLKNARIVAGYKVAEVSEILVRAGYEKVSPKTIYSWESGNSQPTPDCFLKLCEIYGIDDVLSVFGYKKEEPTTESDELEISEKIFMGLPGPQQEEALRYMRYLAEQEDKK